MNQIIEPLMFVQGSSMFPQYVLQRPEVLLMPRVLNLNPLMAGPFGPQGPLMFTPGQGNQVTPHQEQLGPPEDPSAANVPQLPQTPVQVLTVNIHSWVNAGATKKKLFTKLITVIWSELFLTPSQIFPQFQYPTYGFPQLPRQQVWSRTHKPLWKHQWITSFNVCFHSQGFPYFLPPYVYPVLQPPNNPQQNLDRETQSPQLPLQVRHVRPHKAEKRTIPGSLLRENLISWI